MPSESRFVQAPDGIRLHVQLHRATRQPKPTCLLLHGFGDGGYVWEDACAALRATCSTTVVDLRGHGDSEHSPTGVYDLDINVQDVRTIIAHLGVAPIIVVGHSFGGEIALRLAAHPPAPVLGAAFIDISPGVNQDTSKQATVHMQDTLRSYRSAEEYCSLLMSMRPLLSESTARQLARGALRECDGSFQLKLDPALMKYADEEFTSPAQWQQLLPMIHCPTLVMRGAGSAMVSANSAKEMVRVLPRGQLVAIPRAGHAVLSDNPSASCASIANFVASTLWNRALP